MDFIFFHENSRRKAEIQERGIRRSKYTGRKRKKKGETRRKIIHPNIKEKKN